MIGVYGANGFIGRHVVERLAKAGVSARAISRRFDADFRRKSQGDIEFMEADFGQTMAMASSLQDIDTVVQLISTSSPGLRNDHLITDIEENVIPHVGFLQCCAEIAVKRYVFISSGGTIYGPEAPVPTPESAATNPVSSHGLSKLIVEKYIQMFGQLHGLEYVILRVSNAFGPGQLFRKGQGLIPAIMDHWRRGLPIRIYGDGEALRDYVYVEDVVDAIEAALSFKGAPRLTLNIGSGEVRSVAEVVDTMELALGVHFDREYVDARSTDVSAAGLDISLAREVLAWSPATPFQQGIRRTVESAISTRTPR